MRVNDFLEAVIAATHGRLPPARRGFRIRKRFTLVQLYYERRTIHYEVWVRGKERLLEIGLHCEADRNTNGALLDLLRQHTFEIKDELGERVDIEQWTASWTRAHQLMPYSQLDEATAREAGERLAAMIEFLQPLIAGQAAVRPAAHLPPHPNPPPRGARLRDGRRPPP